MDELVEGDTIVKRSVDEQLECQSQHTLYLPNIGIDRREKKIKHEIF